jgi:DNA-binding transcriptional ArsR family regulator
MDLKAAKIAGAIGEPARARMLYCLMDGRARTATELAVVGEVTPSTASVHLAKLQQERLVKVAKQGRHRYFALGGEDVADVLEALNVLAGGARFRPSTPNALRYARTCYDHIAGTLGVALHDSLMTSGCIDRSYEVTVEGRRLLGSIGVDLDAARSARRRFGFACLDWSERRSHLGGALGAALLDAALRRRWVEREADSRALVVTRLGRKEMPGRLGVKLES